KFNFTVKPASADSCLGTGEYEAFFEEVLNGVTPRATELRQSIKLPGNDEAKSWALKAAACVHAAIKWSKSTTIGGEIATIILRRGQRIEWVHRPAFCNRPSGVTH